MGWTTGPAAAWCSPSLDECHVQAQPIRRQVETEGATAQIDNGRALGSSRRLHIAESR